MADHADASPVNSNGTALVLDDLIPCVRTVLPEDDAVYEDAVITLSQTGGSGSVRVLAVRPGATAPFDDDWMVVPFGSNLRYLFFLSTGPCTGFDWYVEGLAAGEAELELTFERDSAICEDLVALTVLQVDLDVDTNRDGAVDDADDGYEDEWLKDRGALFMVNYDDDDGNGMPDVIRFDDVGQPMGENTEIDGANDVADVAPLIIQAAGTKANLQFFLRMAADDLKAIHIFEKREANREVLWGGWLAYAGSNGLLEKEITSQVSETVEVDLGIEALFFRGQRHELPGGGTYEFDGEVDVELVAQVTTGATSIDPSKIIGIDHVRMKVAPYLLLPNTLDATEVWMDQHPGTDDIYNKFGGAAGGVAQRAAPSESQWFQDHVQIGYTGIPARSGSATITQSMHVALRMPYYGQDTWPENELLDGGEGLYRFRDTLLHDSADCGDYGGNLELVPRSDDWPLGRIVVGTTMSTRLRDFLNAQKLADSDAVQKWFVIDTDWLAVGHVDEIIGFVPGGPRGYKVVVASPAYAEDLLRNGDPGRGIAAPQDDAAVFAIGIEASGTSSMSITTEDRAYLFDGVAHGHIACVGAPLLIDGESVVVHDGTVSETFEFDSDDTVDPGNVQVSIAGITLAQQVRDRFRDAINGVSAFQVTAVSDGDPSIVLINDDFGLAGNQPITETVADPGFVIQGMSGGEDAADGMDFSTDPWQYIRLYNGTGAGQVSRITSNGRGWINVSSASDDTVFNTTSGVVWDSGVHVDGLYRYTSRADPIPTDAQWFTEPNQTSDYIVVEDCKQWIDYYGDPFPALHSVYELKNDTLLWTLNAAAQAKVDAARMAIQTAMGNAVGGGIFLRNDGDINDDSLLSDPDDDLIIVPAIYFGEWDGGLKNRASVAYVPGLANFQPASTGVVVFPTPLLASSAGLDVFERATSVIIGTAAMFADDWDRYHRYDGEVHCGTAAKRNEYVFNWWEEQP